MTQSSPLFPLLPVALAALTLLAGHAHAGTFIVAMSGQILFPLLLQLKRFKLVGVTKIHQVDRFVGGAPYKPMYQLTKEENNEINNICGRSSTASFYS